MSDLVTRLSVLAEDDGDRYPAHVKKLAEAAASRIAALEVQIAEMTRRRDEWRKKAEGYDDVRRALREKVGTPWPPHMSRLLWAGIAADEKKRADDAEARLAEARKALEETDRILRDIERHETTRIVDGQDRISAARRALKGGQVE